MGIKFGYWAPLEHNGLPLRYHLEQIIHMKPIFVTLP